MRGAALALAIMAVLGAATSYLVASGRSSAAGHMRSELTLDVERGGIGDLGHAQALGRRLVVADPNDREAAAALAFVSAELAVDYGLDTAREIEAVLVRIPANTTESPDAASSVAAAARALVLVREGKREAAVRQATVAAAAAPGVPHPLYALGRARALSGDLAGAARALEAAIVGTPAFSAARVAWAEVRLDLGDARTARAALEAVLAHAPKDLRAQLLLEEAEQALGEAGTSTLKHACLGRETDGTGKWPPSAVQAGCALAYAVRARKLGSRTEAVVRANTAATAAPEEPRLLARIATALAQLGSVDRAVILVERARHLAAPATPALAWAMAAVTLGRGKGAALPSGPRPADPETRLMAARAALATGGLGELTQVLDALGPRALALDSDLHLLARLRGEPAGPEAAEDDDPLRAYVDGLHARLGGDLPGAAEHLRHALSGHGDACRAAGEYVATLRALKQRPDPAIWTPLRAENATCINLR